MPKYYNHIRNQTNLNRQSGSAINLQPEFRILTSKIIADCIFAQSQIQKLIYTAHAAEINKAGYAAKKFVTSQSRIEYLYSFDSISDDKIISSVFSYAKQMFSDIYELRNALSHDVWSSSESFPNTLLLSKLEEEAKLLFSSGKLIHVEGTTSKKIYDSIVRYINHVKIITQTDIERACADIDLCNLCLMQIDIALNQDDIEQREIIKKSFLVFEGISHIFPKEERLSESVNFNSKKINSTNI